MDERREWEIYEHELRVTEAEQAVYLELCREAATTAGLSETLSLDRGHGPAPPLPYSTPAA